MKAVYLTQPGTTSDVLTYVTDAPVPTIAADEVLVKVGATSVNRIDLVMRGGYPGMETTYPHILGGDVAGTIEEVGSTVEGWKVGDRIVAYPMVWWGHCELCSEGNHNLCLNWKYFGMHLPGGYAEYVAVPSKCLIALPEQLSFAQATALGVAGLTAYHGLCTVADLQPGQTFMIWGGSGGLGTLAIQIGKHRGATVIATCSSDDKKQALRDLGADVVLNHTTENVFDEVKKLYPVGLDTVMDYVGPKTFQQSFDLLKKGGQLLLCGILTGRETNFSIHMTYLRHLSIKGLYLGTKAEMEELVWLVAAGKINPHIGDVLPLSAAAKAQDRLVKGDFTGKLVLQP